MVYFRGTKEGEKVRNYIEDGFNIVTPTVVIAELSDKYERSGKAKEWQVRSHFIKMKSEIADLNFQTAEGGGRIKCDLRQHNNEVGLADSLILSYAVDRESKLLTGDDDLTFRDEVVDISI